MTWLPRPLLQGPSEPPVSIFSPTSFARDSVHANRSPSCLLGREKEVALTAVEATRSLAALEVVCGEIEAQFSSASISLSKPPLPDNPRLNFPFEINLCYANVPSRSITSF